MHSMTSTWAPLGRGGFQGIQLLAHIGRAQAPIAFPPRDVPGQGKGAGGLSIHPQPAGPQTGLNQPGNGGLAPGAVDMDDMLQLSPRDQRLALFQQQQQQEGRHSSGNERDILHSSIPRWRRAYSTICSWSFRRSSRGEATEGFNGDDRDLKQIAHRPVDAARGPGRWAERGGTQEPGLGIQGQVQQEVLQAVNAGEDQGVAQKVHPFPVGDRLVQIQHQVGLRGPDVGKNGKSQPAGFIAPRPGRGKTCSGPACPGHSACPPWPPWHWPAPAHTRVPRAMEMSRSSRPAPQAARSLP